MHDESEEDSLIKIERLFNAFAVLSIIMLSVVALIYQFFLYQLPCPLCLLQRIGYLTIAFGFLLNLRFGLQPSHYSLVLLSALFNCFVSLRHLSLNAITGTGYGYFGATLFGFHLSTWSFVVSLVIVVSVTIILGFARQYETVYSQNTYWKSITFSLFAMLAILIFTNMVAVFLQCGLSPCPDIPVGYKMLSAGSPP